MSKYDIRTQFERQNRILNVKIRYSAYFDIRNRAKYHILNIKILFWHSSLGRISYFDIQNRILTFENRAEYRILTFKILFWHSNLGRILYFEFKILFWRSNWGRISYFDIQNPILTFVIGPNIVFWYSKSYFDMSNLGRISYFDIQNPILTFEIGQNIDFEFKILFWHSNCQISYFDMSKSYFDIRTCRISYFDIQNPILTFELKISYFDIQNPILTFELRPNIVFWHSKSYFDIRTWAEYRILTFKILFWHSNWGRISYFDIQNPILTFEIGRKSILIIKILFWHSSLGQISYFDIQNPILTFELGPNIVFWHSKSYFDDLGRISYLDIQNPILTFKLSNIVFWHSKSYFDIRNRRISYFEFKIGFWHELKISILIQNPILTFECQNIDFEYQNPIFDIRPNSNVKIGFWMSKYDIRPKSFCSNFKIGFWMSKYDFRPEFEFQNPILTCQNTIFDQNLILTSNCQNRILTFKILFRPIRIGQNITFWMSKYDIRSFGRIRMSKSYFEKIRFWHRTNVGHSKSDIRTCRISYRIQNRILNVKIRYSTKVRIVKIGFWISKYDIRARFRMSK